MQNVEKFFYLNLWQTSQTYWFWRYTKEVLRNCHLFMLDFAILTALLLSGHPVHNPKKCYFFLVLDLCRVERRSKLLVSARWPALIHFSVFITNFMDYFEWRPARKKAKGPIFRTAYIGTAEGGVIGCSGTPNIRDFWLAHRGEAGASP